MVINIHINSIYRDNKDNYGEKDLCRVVIKDLDMLFSFSISFRI